MIACCHIAHSYESVAATWLLWPRARLLQEMPNLRGKGGPLCDRHAREVHNKFPSLWEAGFELVALTPQTDAAD